MDESILLDGYLNSLPASHTAAHAAANAASGQLAPCAHPTDGMPAEDDEERELGEVDVPNAELCLYLRSASEVAVLQAEAAARTRTPRL